MKLESLTNSQVLNLYIASVRSGCSIKIFPVREVSSRQHHKSLTNSRVLKHLSSERSCPAVFYRSPSRPPRANQSGGRFVQELVQEHLHNYTPTSLVIQEHLHNYTPTDTRTPTQEYLQEHLYT